ncbi:MAG TPA: hypothetical protein VGJ20_13720 [Xanthobacteraceae bacterium]
MSASQLAGAGITHSADASTTNAHDNGYAPSAGVASTNYSDGSPGAHSPAPAQSLADAGVPSGGMSASQLAASGITTTDHPTYDTSPPPDTGVQNSHTDAGVPSGGMSASQPATSGITPTDHPTYDTSPPPDGGPTDAGGHQGDDGGGGAAGADGGGAGGDGGGGTG